MPPPALRVGLVGYGYAGRTFHAPLIAGVPGLVLAAVSSRDPARVHADWPGVEVLPDAQALIAPRRPRPGRHRQPERQPLPARPRSAGGWPPRGGRQALHADAGRSARAVRAGACTRSAAVGVPQPALGQRLPDAARADRARRRWGASSISSRRFDRFRPEVRARWRESAAPGAGLWFDLGPHLLDQALQLFGWPQAITLDQAALRDGGQSDDWFQARLRYPAARVVLRASMLAAAADTALRRARHARQLGQARAGRAGRRAEGRRAPDLAAAPGWGEDRNASLLTLPRGDALAHRAAAAAAGLPGRVLRRRARRAARRWRQPGAARTGRRGDGADRTRPAQPARGARVLGAAHRRASRRPGLPRPSPAAQTAAPARPGGAHEDRQGAARPRAPARRGAGAGRLPDLAEVHRVAQRARSPRRRTRSTRWWPTRAAGRTGRCGTGATRRCRWTTAARPAAPAPPGRGRARPRATAA